MIRRASEMRQEERQFMRGGDGTIKIKHILEKGDLRQNRLHAIIEIPSYASIGEHEHANEDELFYIIEGEAEMTNGDEKLTLRAGDAIVTGGGKTHSVRNPGETPLRIMAFITTYE